MNRYTPKERGVIVMIFLRNNSSVVLAQREFRRRFPGRPTPTGQTLRRLAARLEEYGTTRDAARSGRPRSSRSAENIAAVIEDIAENPGVSIRRRATQLGINRRSLHRILVNDCKMFPYKVQRREPEEEEDVEIAADELPDDEKSKKKEPKSKSKSKPAPKKKDELDDELSEDEKSKSKTAKSKPVKKSHSKAKKKDEAEVEECEVEEDESV